MLIDRYMARVVLVPFLFNASAVEVGQLDEVLSGAPAAFPCLLKVGSNLVKKCSSDLYDIREIICACVPDIDSRLATQYSLSMLSCQLVSQ